MKILLDTHVFLWYTKSDRKLNAKSRSMIQNAIEVYVSSASIWEATIKARLGKLNVNIDDLVKAITSSGFLELLSLLSMLLPLVVFPIFIEIHLIVYYLLKRLPNLSLS